MEETAAAFLRVYAVMHEQSGKFTLAQRLNDSADKLIRWHPHVVRSKTKGDDGCTNAG